jgi:hypothetical protein
VSPNIKKFWVYREVTSLNPNAPHVAKKTDLRDRDSATVSKESEELLAEEIDGARYFEVSS